MSRPRIAALQALLDSERKARLQLQQELDRERHNHTVTGRELANVALEKTRLQHDLRDMETAAVEARGELRVHRLLLDRLLPAPPVASARAYSGAERPNDLVCRG